MLVVEEMADMVTLPLVVELKPLAELVAQLVIMVVTPEQLAL